MNSQTKGPSTCSIKRHPIRLVHRQAAEQFSVTRVRICVQTCCRAYEDVRLEVDAEAAAQQHPLALQTRAAEAEAAQQQQRREKIAAHEHHLADAEVNSHSHDCSAGSMNQKQRPRPPLWRRSISLEVLSVIPNATNRPLRRPRLRMQSGGQRQLSSASRTWRPCCGALAASGPKQALR